MTPIVRALFWATLLVAPATDEAADETQRLLDEADTRYQTSDYEGAVEAFTQAYATSRSIEDAELRGLVQAALLFNLGRAHLRAYATNEQPEHLRRAIELFEKYLGQVADLGDRVEAESYVAEARAELERLSGAPTSKPEPKPTTTTEPTPPPPRAKPGRGMKVAGYTTLGLASVGVGVLAGGLGISGAAQRDYDAGPTRAIRDDAITRGQLGNVMTIAGGVFAGAMVITGVALIVSGKSKARRDLARVAAPMIMIGHQQLGLSLSGSF